MKLYSLRALISATIAFAFFCVDGYATLSNINPINISWVLFWLYLTVTNLLTAFREKPADEKISDERRAWRASPFARHLQMMFTISFVVLLIAMVVARMAPSTYLFSMPIVLVAFGFVVLSWGLYLYLMKTAK